MAKQIITFIFCIAFVVTNVKAQSDTMQPKFIAKGYDYRIDRSKLIKSYADSLNNYSVLNNVPEFIFNECFEYDIKLRKDYHSTASIRWEILKKVTNKEALQMILKTDAPRLKIKCTKYKGDRKLKNTFSDKSFYDLLKKRYDALK